MCLFVWPGVMGVFFLFFISLISKSLEINNQYNSSYLGTGANLSVLQHQQLSQPKSSYMHLLAFSSRPSVDYNIA